MCSDGRPLFFKAAYKILTKRDESLYLRSCAGVPVIKNRTEEVTGATVVVKWEPPLDGACPVDQYKVYYSEVILQAENKNWSSVTVNRNTTSYTIQLTCGREYEIAVTSLATQRESNFHESRIWKFKIRGGNGAFMRLNFKAILKTILVQKGLTVDALQSHS